ncbi:hypothetical protein AMIS_47200 [Actinoplanes missouriensis 431]|uniref:DUF1684 domain-containing protein n=1 Tax=Actinoplanes missouriensis (strain ATCC 14538 / DSM 43046 / CBS 188.64 / JCM 3121 / NBRC 102363 / NCIMB 12654 / NRRL B-3342 / UNCC 431) TaxID=512565 RepID=I0HAA3_ACTM4|nr:DUF1684 domain-containing protein [Actinoplanes missouriensis]BAL89940.1 hypothetical protein AMIS_47200 [Actinoplanes missouriensis 431]
MSENTAAQQHAAWREERLRAVTSPTGNLALVETRWGADDPAAALAGQPATVTATRLSRRDPLTGAQERGVRLWDAASPAIKSFEGIDTYPYDPAWVLEARYTDVSGDRRVPFQHAQDAGFTRDLPVPGDLHLTLDGRDYTLSAFDDDGRLLLVFGDPTNGTETYGAGRFLFVEREPGTERVVLDLNRAFVPPCGFSEHYNCPMPPPQNRLHLPVRAGEKLAIFHR